MIIRRIHNINDFERRPLISKSLSEYIYSLFERHILTPKGLLKKGNVDYSITLDFVYGEFTRENYPGIIVDNEIETRLYKMPLTFVVHPKDFTYFSKNEKNAHIRIIDPGVRFDISNEHYARLTVVMIHKFLLRKYKKITESDYSLIINEIDNSILASIPNPCKFKEQEYVFDSSIEYDYFRRFRQ